MAQSPPLKDTISPRENQGCAQTGGVQDCERVLADLRPVPTTRFLAEAWQSKCVPEQHRASVGKQSPKLCPRASCETSWPTRSSRISSIQAPRSERLWIIAPLWATIAKKACFGSQRKPYRGWPHLFVQKLLPIRALMANRPFPAHLIVPLHGLATSKQSSTLSRTVSPDSGSGQASVPGMFLSATKWRPVSLCTEAFFERGDHPQFVASLQYLFQVLQMETHRGLQGQRCCAGFIEPIRQLSRL